MIKLFFLKLVLLLFILSGCSSSEIITAWKEKGAQRSYNKIMVVGIVKDSSPALRKFIEDSFVQDLRSIGYNAVSALREFGAKGLTDIEQEANYLKLCNNGIDAVITVALLDKEKERYYTPSCIKYYSGPYYYNRIWSYRNMQAEPIPASHFSNLETKYLWERILFDSQTLSPVYVAQTKSFEPAFIPGRAQQYQKRMVAEMMKYRILQKQAQPHLDKKPF